MFIYLFALTSAFISSIAVYESCEDVSENISFLCVAANELNHFKFPDFLHHDLKILIFSSRISSIDLSPIKDYNIEKLTINGSNIRSKFLLDIKSLPTSLKSLQLNDMVLCIKEASTIDYEIEGTAIIIKSEASKITQGPNFKAAIEMEKTFGVSNTVNYTAYFVVDNCDEYSNFYRYKCIRADTLEKEKYLDYYRPKTSSYPYIQLKIYLHTDVPFEHPVRILSEMNLDTSFNREVFFIGMNRTKEEGKYQITLDVEKTSAYTKMLFIDFINVNLSFNQVKSRVPSGCSLRFHNVHFEPLECSRRIFERSETSAITSKYMSGHVTQCLGLSVNLKPDRLYKYYISDNCEDVEFDPIYGKCFSHEEYSDDFVYSITNRDHLFIYFDRSLNRVLNLNYPNLTKLESLYLYGIGEENHPSVQIDLDANASINTLYFHDITLKLKTQRKGQNTPPFNSLILYNTIIDYENYKEAHWNFSYFKSDNITSYDILGQDKSKIIHNYNKLIISHQEPEECFKIIRTCCIKPEKVNLFGFKSFFEPLGLESVLTIEVHASVDEEVTLDFDWLRPTNFVGYMYDIKIFGIGDNASLAINLVDYTQYRHRSISAENINLTLKTNEIREPRYFSNNYKFSDDVILSGENELIMVKPEKIRSPLRAHFEYLHSPFPTYYHQLDVKDFCGEETENDFRLKCITPPELKSQDFTDFAEDVGILISTPIGDEKPIDFSGANSSAHVVIKSVLSGESKQKVSINVSSIQEDQSFTFSNIDLSFDVGDSAIPMIIPASHITIEGCTVSESECSKIMLNATEQLTSDSRSLYQCFGIKPPAYAGISVGSDMGPRYKYLAANEVSSYDFADFVDQTEINIYINYDLETEQSFQFNKLSSSKSIFLVGSSFQTYWLDVENIGNFVTSLKFSALSLDFKTTGSSNTVNVKELIILNCAIQSASCSSIRLKADSILISEKKEIFECFGTNYPAIVVENTCTNKYIDNRVCVAKDDAPTYKFDDKLTEHLSEIKIVLNTDIDDTKTFNFKNLPNVDQLSIESDSLRDFSFDAGSYNGKLSLKKLRFKVKSVAKELDLQSVEFRGCTIIRGQCELIQSTKATKENCFADSLEVYECLSIPTEFGFVVSDDCSQYGETIICESPERIGSSTYSRLSKAKKINIGIKSSVLSTNPLKFDFSQFKMSVTIKPMGTKMSEALKLYIDADTMKDNLESLSIENVDLSFITKDAGSKLELDFPVSLKEVSVDPSSCDKITITGGLSSDKDFSKCFGVETAPTNINTKRTNVYPATEIKNSKRPVPVASDPIEDGDSNDPTKGTLGAGSIVGIVIGVIAVVVIIAVAVIFIMRKNNDSEDEELSI